MSDARAAVLGRIRAALGPRPAEPPVPRGYRQAGAEVDFDAAARFAERVSDYRATVFPSAAEAVAATGASRLACAPGLHLRLDGVELLRDEPPLALDILDGVDGVVTGCAVAIAETGTIVLDGAPASGRRLLSLVPDYHLCLVRPDQIVATVPDALAVLHEAAADGRPVTFVSGPSATSDIELERVEGVHGPRTLHVVIAD